MRDERENCLALFFHFAVKLVFYYKVTLSLKIQNLDFQCLKNMQKSVFHPQIFVMTNSCIAENRYLYALDN